MCKRELQTNFLLPETRNSFSDSDTNSANKTSNGFMAINNGYGNKPSWPIIVKYAIIYLDDIRINTKSK
jgi:hypothetical protein